MMCSTYSVALWLMSAVATKRWLYFSLLELYNQSRCQSGGGIMANLTHALQQLRAEQGEAQLHVEKLGQGFP